MKVGIQEMAAMDLFTISIDAAMVGKIYNLACATMSEPDNGSAENIAVNLLDKALDAALAVYHGKDGVVDLGNTSVKLALVHPLPVHPVAPKKGGTKR